MILVSGPTGNIGALLITELIRLRVPVRALLRDLGKNPEQAQALTQQGVETVNGDLADLASLAPAMRGVQSAFLLVPVSQQTIELKRNFVTAAKAAGVAHIVNLSVSGAAPDAPFSLGKWHWQAEQDLEKSGIAWSHIRPTDLARYATHMFLATAKTQGAFYSTAGDGKIPMVDEADVATVAAVALTNKGHENRAYRVTGPEALSFAEAANILSSALGSPVKYVDISPQSAKEGMLKAGLPAWIADFINDLRAMERANLTAEVSPAVKDITGKAAKPYAESVSAVLGRSK